jgi:CO dehydrogenase/acetyl-CoA synthase gamma subunit (corrinoid Fe-S protein)
MRTQKTFLAQLASLVTPFRLYAVAPAKEPTLVEKFNAWLKDKDTLSAQIAAATTRAETAEAALATAAEQHRVEAQAKADALTEAAEKLTAAETKATSAESQVSGLRSQVSAFEALFASIGFTPKADSKPEEVQTAFKAHISAGVTQQVQEIGFPIGKLPAATNTDTADSLAEIQQQLANCKDPVQAGLLAQKANALRDQVAAASAARN